MTEPMIERAGFLTDEDCREILMGYVKLMSQLVETLVYPPRYIGTDVADSSPYKIIHHGTEEA